MRLFIRPFDVAGFLTTSIFYPPHQFLRPYAPFLQIEEAEPLRRTGQIDLSLVDDLLLLLELYNLAYLVCFHLVAPDKRTIHSDTQRFRTLAHGLAEVRRNFRTEQFTHPFVKSDATPASSNYPMSDNLPKDSPNVVRPI